MTTLNKPLLYRHFHRIAWLAVALATCVIVFGAFVRLSNAGLSCPDWPTCYGKAAWPTHAEQIVDHVATEIRPVEPSKAWREQFHRHIAAGLGLLVFALALLAARRRRFGIAQVLGAVALVAIAIPLYMQGQHVASSVLVAIAEAALLWAALRWSNVDLARTATGTDPTVEPGAVAVVPRLAHQGESALDQVGALATVLLDVVLHTDVDRARLGEERVRRRQHDRGRLAVLAGDPGGSAAHLADDLGLLDHVARHDRGDGDLAPRGVGLHRGYARRPVVLDMLDASRLTDTLEVPCARP